MTLAGSKTVTHSIQHPYVTKEADKAVVTGSQSALKRNELIAQ